MLIHDMIYYCHSFVNWKFSYNGSSSYSRYACDKSVVRLMRERGLGNSATQLSKKIREQHTDRWMEATVQYLSACEIFRNRLVVPPAFPKPPEQPAIPKPRWFMTVYAQDVLGRLDEIKASITSTYGSVLKIDSTKKVVVKLITINVLHRVV